MREPSHAYMRGGFFLGFIGVSVGTLPLVCRLLDIPPELLWGGSGLLTVPLGKRTLLVVGPTMLGLLSGLLGLRLFASIGKGHPAVERVLGSVWHYSSTGAITWVTLSALQLLIGSRWAMVSQQLPAMQTTLVVLGSGLASGVLMYVMLLTAGSMLRKGYLESCQRLSRLGPLVVGVTTGIVQCALLDIPWWSGTIAGVLYPYVLIPWAEAMCLRDGLR